MAQFAMPNTAPYQSSFVAVTGECGVHFSVSFYNPEICGKCLKLNPKEFSFLEKQITCRYKYKKKSESDRCRIRVYECIHMCAVMGNYGYVWLSI